MVRDLDYNQALSARDGYDRVAHVYGSWHWCSFWRRNERPFVSKWLERMPHGIGLDAGAGIGSYVQLALLLGHRCIAADVSARMLDVARLSLMDRFGDSVSFVTTDITDIALPGDSLDWILCTRVLSHIENPARAIGEFARLLRPGGTCFLSDIHPEHPYDYTVIRAKSQQVRIRTIKHPLALIRHSILRTDRLAIEAFHQFTTVDLPCQSLPHQFAKLTNVPHTPIFYACLLKRVR